jgi:hypothetical protein
MPEWNHQGCLATTRRASNRLLEVDCAHPIAIGCSMRSPSPCQASAARTVTADPLLWPMTWPMFWLAQACSSLPGTFAELR